MKNNGWVIVVFEKAHAQFAGEVAYVKGPFDKYEEAEDWANSAKDCADGEWQMAFIE